MNHFVYIVRCADGTLYTGYATDVEKRVREHNGETKGKVAARYTRGRRPVELVYSEPCTSRSEALKREYAIKQLSKEAKQQLAMLL
jgi:putative endonuclease